MSRTVGLQVFYRWGQWEECCPMKRATGLSMADWWWQGMGIGWCELASYQLLSNDEQHCFTCRKDVMDVKEWTKKKVNWYREVTRKTISHGWKNVRSVNDKLMLYAGLGFEFMLSAKKLKYLPWASNTLARRSAKGLCSLHGIPIDKTLLKMNSQPKFTILKSVSVVLEFWQDPQSLRTTCVRSPMRTGETCKLIFDLPSE